MLSYNAVYQDLTKLRRRLVTALMNGTLSPDPPMLGSEEVLFLLDRHFQVDTYMAYKHIL
jgi:hypothetical protein